MCVCVCISIAYFTHKHLLHPYLSFSLDNLCSVDNKEDKMFKTIFALNFSDLAKETFIAHFSCKSFVVTTFRGL